jgi:hypothetical protein
LIPAAQNHNRFSDLAAQSSPIWRQNKASVADAGEEYMTVMNPPSPNAAVVVPTFNEGEVIHVVARRVLENQIVSGLIVDDSSADDTIEIVKALHTPRSALGISMAEPLASWFA